MSEVVYCFILIETECQCARKLMRQVRERES